jgi:heme-degrading monooxygenase HmoA
MIAVVFEVEPAEVRKPDYLDIAAEMRSVPDQIGSFISVERVQSLPERRKILSLSFFEHEAAIARWRNLSAYSGAQARGRTCAFADYRLRIASVIRDYGMFDRTHAPSDTRRVHAE